MLTDQFLRALLPAVIGWLSRAEQAGGGWVGDCGGELGAGVFARGGQLCSVTSERGEGVEGGGWGVWGWLLSCCAHGMPS